MRTLKISKILQGIILLLLVLPGPLRGAEKKAPVRIKVLCYNIHHANPPSRAGYIDLPAIARVILESGADLVALQEVDVHTERSGKSIHQARSLAELCGMYFYFVKNIDYQGGDYGVAVLSKYPIIDSAAYQLPMKEGIKGEPRGVAVVKVKLPNNNQMLFASTHFDRVDANKPVQAEAVNKIFKGKKLPVILAGDFNAQPGEEAITILDRQFTRTCTKDCGFTIPVLRPAKTIDHIMYRRGGSIRVLSHRVIRETYASDHLPVFSELEINQKR